MKAYEYAPKRPLTRYYIGRDRESGIASIVLVTRPQFKGGSLSRKRSKEWYRYGDWSYIHDYSNEKAIEHSPYLKDLEFIFAASEEEALEQYNKA